MRSSMFSYGKILSKILPVQIANQVPAGSNCSLVYLGNFHHVRGLSSTFVLLDKSKDTTGKGGDKGILDSDGFSLDMDANSQEKLANLKRILEKNTYYEKYKAKIVESQK